jgi:hypothetical protein
MTHPSAAPPPIRTPLRLLGLLVVVALCVAGLPAAAHADRADDLLEDCSFDERIDGSYTRAEYDRALRRIGTDLDEYTDCRNVIRRARDAAVARSRGGGGSGGGAGGGAGGFGGGAGGGGGGSFGGGGFGGGGFGGVSDPAMLAPGGFDGTRGLLPADDVEARALRAAQDGRPLAGGPSVIPRTSGLAASATRNALPEPLLALLILLGVAALASAGLGARRVIDRRGT